MSSDTQKFINQFQPDQFEIHQFERDNGVPVRTSCRLLASADSRNGVNHRRPKRWTELELYLTEKGAFIARTVGKSSVAGERDMVRINICKDVSEVINVFGNGWVANMLYGQAGITAVEVVE